MTCELYSLNIKEYMYINGKDVCLVITKKLNDAFVICITIKLNICIARNFKTTNRASITHDKHSSVTNNNIKFCALYFWFCHKINCTSQCASAMVEVTGNVEKIMWARRLFILVKICTNHKTNNTLFVQSCKIYDNVQVLHQY